MLGLTLSVLLLQLVVPIGLLLWLLYSDNDSLAQWFARVLFVGGYIGLVALIGAWHIVGLWLRYLFPLLLLIIIAVTFRRSWHLPWLPQRGRRAWAPTIALGLAGLALSLPALILLPGREPPPVEPVEVAFPLRDGLYGAVNAGSNRFLNPHLRVLEHPALADYRGQAYALDIVKLNRLGLRANGLLPQDLERYAVYGDLVYAPCDGQVLALEDALPDLIPPNADRDNKPGNYVLLRCANVEILLAHLQQHSLAVTPGERVVEGQVLGKVGNSGNTSEPHLHIHAQRPAPDGAPFLSGDPLPLVLDDRYLSRNQWLWRTPDSRIDY